MRSAVLFTLLALATPAAAQETIRVTTRLVQVNVVVTGKGGRPAAGLTPEDFELLDEGRPQNIRAFAADAAGIKRREAAPLPVNTFTNRLDERRDLPTSVTAILFDQLNTSYPDQGRAKRHLIRFLETIDPQRRIALYALNRDIRVLHDFTSDAQALLDALKRHRMQISGEMLATVPNDTVTGYSDMDEWLRELKDAEERIAHFETHLRVMTTLNALESIAHHMARIPGRKSLIWVSGSFPFSMTVRELFSAAGQSSGRPGDYAQEVERCARVLNEANVAVYPVHATGVATLSAFSAERQRQTPDNEPGMKLLSAQDSMKILAARTGGRAYYNDNDIARAMKECFDDGEVSYTLGFYPAHGTWDGRFREVKVRMKRPGLRARHRGGYFAFPEPAETTPERERALRDAVWSPLDAHAIALDVRVEARPNGAIRVSGTLDGRNVVLDHSESGRWAGQIDLLYVQHAADGRTISGVNDTVDLSMAAARREQMIRSGASFTRDIKLAPEAYTVRVVARDARSGAVGSLTIPVSAILR